LRKPIIKIEIIAVEVTDKEGNTTIVVTLKPKANRNHQPPIYLSTAVPEQLKNALKGSQFKDWRFVLTRDFAGRLIDEFLLKYSKDNDAWNVS